MTASPQALINPLLCASVQTGRLSSSQLNMAQFGIYLIFCQQITSTEASTLHPEAGEWEGEVWEPHLPRLPTSKCWPTDQLLWDSLQGQL